MNTPLPQFNEVPLPRGVDGVNHQVSVRKYTQSGCEAMAINGWFSLSEARALYDWLGKTLPKDADYE